MKSRCVPMLCLCVAASLGACQGKNATSPEAEADSQARPIETTETTAPEVSAIPAPADVAAVPADADKSESGLAWKVLKPGEGDRRPDRYDIVTLDYTGWTPEGRMFVTSRKPTVKRRGTLEDFLPGWIEGVQLMLPGERRRFWIPGKLAYGEPDGAEGGEGAKANPEEPRGMVVFDLELVEFKRGPRPPRAVPEDVAAIPANAERSKSGLAWRVLQQGTGKVHPSLDSRVFVHYVGWTAAGKTVDTSLALGGRPATFIVKEAAMAGWKEVIPMMAPGEVRRVWLPEDLASAGRSGFPRGMLVYDIHLIEVSDVEGPEN